MSTSTEQAALPIAPLNDPSLPTRLAAEHAARGSLPALVLQQHDDQGHRGVAKFCDWAACRLAHAIGR